MSVTDDQNFTELINRAYETPIDGWHFTFLNGRVASTDLPWDYQRLAAEHVASARRVLDVDTGGGEKFAEMLPPRGSAAVEDWPTNIPIARQRLQPNGITVTSRINHRIPLDASSFDLVLNRHGDLDFNEAARLLRPGGMLFSQQVTTDNEDELSQAFGVHPTRFPNAVTSLRELTARATAGTFTVEMAAESVTTTRYLDVGAVVLQLRAVPWQVPGFDATEHLNVLHGIHQQIQRTGSFEVHSARLLLQARAS